MLFLVPLKLSRSLRAPPDLTGPAHPPLGLSPSLPVGPGHHFNSTWDILSLLKIYCYCVCLQPFPQPHLLLLLMGSLASTVGLDLGLLMAPATSPQLCPLCSAPVGPCAFGEGTACAGSPLTPMPLGISWPLLLPDILLWSMDLFFLFIFWNRSTFWVHLWSTG